MKYSPTLALEVCQGIESGKRSGSSYGRHYGLDVKEIRLWLAQYRFYGPAVFDETATFSRAERLHIVEDKLKNGLSLTRTCIKYKILHRCTLRYWIRLYNESRLESMSDKGKNKKKQEAPLEEIYAAKQRIREFERQLLYARAENAFQKKLQALIQETKGH